MTEEQKPFEAKATGLDLLRKPFPDHQISQLPKGTKAQNDCPANQKKNCSICGGWHHPEVKHLSYVGHAAVTDRLLDSDPFWSWEPLALKDGLPAFDATGGLWIRLTVCGHSRVGYGHAIASAYKEIGSREKEVIGDAIRNAAMRFGAALELWHKGDLHILEPEDTDGSGEGIKMTDYEKWEIKAKEVCEAAKKPEDIIPWWPANKDAVTKDLKKEEAAKIRAMVVLRKQELEKAERVPGQEG